MYSSAMTINFGKLWSRSYMKHCRVMQCSKVNKQSLEFEIVVFNCCVVLCAKEERFISDHSVKCR